MSKTKPKLIIIDGNALIHRSFHALPPTLRTKNGQLVNAVYGFTAFLLKALNEFRPEFVVLTLDKKGPTFRHRAYAEYKATRVKAPDELYEQIPLVKSVAEAFNIPIFEKTGFEADDLIGTICKSSSTEKNLEKIIITGDLDTLQLVDSQTLVYTMSRGLSDSVLYGPAEVSARYGLRPEQLIDYKALRGDPSDNIPGVRGIGEKTAATLINQFHSLDKLYEAVKRQDKKISPRSQELLSAGEEEAYLSRRLVTIDQQAPIDFSLEKIGPFTFQAEAIISLFSQLEFRSLLPKVKELRDNLFGRPIDAPEKQTPAAQSKYRFINDDQSLASLIKKLKSARALALEVELSGSDPLSAKLLGLSLSYQPGEAYTIALSPARLAKLKPFLEDEKLEKYGHNLKLVWRALKLAGIELRGLALDAMIASYLLNPSHRQHDLSSLAFTELGLEMIGNDSVKGAAKKQLAFNLGETPDLSQLAEAAGQRADFSGRLAAIFIKRLAKEKMTPLLKDVEMPLIPVLGAMENNGIKLETKLLETLSKQVKKDLRRLEQAIYKSAGGKFNINSTKQLKEILFEKLAIPTNNIKKIKTGFSTAEEELEKIKDLHPVVSLLQEYRELNKLQTTYLEALPKMLNPQTGRIHTSFNQTIAATGRLSSTEPNLQNIPTRTEAGRKIRAAFVAEAGWRLVSFDYSQIELRLAAHMSSDAKMIKAFQDGQDIHAITAAEINGVDLDKVTKKMRQEAKAVNFGVLYGQGAHGLSQSAGIPYWQASEFIKKYFQVYPRIKKMVDNSIKEAKRIGYTETMLGRKRPLEDINSQIPAARRSAERMAINAPLQGTAADLIKLAMIKVAEKLQGKEEEIKLLLQIHDELIFEVKQAKLETYSPLIKQAMQAELKLKVPIIVDESSGDNWGELK